MTWMQTLTGTPFDILAPKAAMIDFREICAALGQTNRFCGHTDKPVSVALHTLNVAKLVDAASRGNVERAFEKKHGRKPTLGPELAGHALPWALLHDAKEAFIGDKTTPVKEAEVETARRLGGDEAAKLMVAVQHAIEKGVDDAILEASGLRWRSRNYPDADAIAAVSAAAADLQALVIERNLFMARSKRPWGVDAMIEAGKLAIPRDLDAFAWLPGPEAAEQLYRLMTKHLPALWPSGR